MKYSFIVCFSLSPRIVLNLHIICFIGGTVVAALELLKKRGVDDKQIKVVSK